MNIEVKIHRARAVNDGGDEAPVLISDRLGVLGLVRPAEAPSFEGDVAWFEAERTPEGLVFGEQLPEQDW